jgi:hypothetical protein
VTDEFLTRGLEQDRYLTALRLTEEFETQMAATLRTFGRRMVDQHPDLFATNPDGDEHTNQSTSSTLAHTRVNYAMAGERAPDRDRTLKLNVHLYWLRPAEYDRTDIDGALRAFGYKVKYADRSIDDRIASETRASEFAVRSAENPYDANIAFYRHVSSAADIEETADALVDHFSTFGDQYAADGSE